MTRYRQYFAALVAGALLATVCVGIKGFVAARPVPWLESFRHEHRELAFFALVGIGAAPLVISGWLGGWVLFRKSSIVSPRLWLLIAAPWTVYTLIGPVEYAASSIRIDGLLTAGLIVGVASLPLGIWLASLATHRRVSTAR